MTRLFLSTVCESAFFFLGQAWCQYSLEAAGESYITSPVLCTASASVKNESQRDTGAKAFFLKESFLSEMQLQQKHNACICGGIRRS